MAASGDTAIWPIWAIVLTSSIIEQKRPEVKKKTDGVGFEPTDRW